MSGKITWRPRKGKTWREKLCEHHPNHGKVMPVPPSMRRTCGMGTIVISRSRDIGRGCAEVVGGRVTRSEAWQNKSDE